MQFYSRVVKLDEIDMIDDIKVRVLKCSMQCMQCSVQCMKCSIQFSGTLGYGKTGWEMVKL